MARLGRRHFVKGSLGAAGAAALFSGLFSRRASANAYGELVADPDGILDLPEGFSYVVLQTAGEDMDDGYVVPGRPDGMACFAGEDGNWILMRNHEVSLNDASNGAYGAGEAPPEAYDDAAFGGVSRVVIDPAAGSVVSSNLVLTGTVRNCAGGPSPWGWLSCEEDVSASHGYVFVCPESAASVVDAEPVINFGRFNHEAAAVDPRTLITYLTEDRFDGCFYRHVPADVSDPFTGRLQALRIVGTDAEFTNVYGTVGETLDVEWVDIDDPNPADDSIRMAAQAAGASIFTRGEGLWYFDGEVYFSCTNGGPSGLGQIFRLVDGADGGTLELIAVSDGLQTLDFPDNITVAPWGELFIAEDGSAEQFVRFIDADGAICDFARNAVSDSEFAGVCFSPDGSAMFVNIQEQGLTLMVTGPFPDGDGGDESTGGDDSTGENPDTEGDSADETGPEPGSGSASGTGTSGPDASGTSSAETEASSDSDTGGGGSADGGGGCRVQPGSDAAGVVAAAVALGAGLLTKQASDTPDDA